MFLMKSTLHSFSDMIDSTRKYFSIFSKILSVILLWEYSQYDCRIFKLVLNHHIFILSCVEDSLIFVMLSFFVKLVLEVKQKPTII